MDKNVVTVEVATAEVEAWMDFKKISAQKRETRKEQTETIIGAIVEGSLILEENKFTQILKEPFGVDVKFEKLEYKSRIPIDLVHMHLKNVKSDDPDGRLLAHVAALTQKPKDVLKKMDTEDYATAQAIAYFFL